MKTPGWITFKRPKVDHFLMTIDTSSLRALLLRRRPLRPSSRLIQTLYGRFQLRGTNGL
jgi:hypothetical protein